MCSMTSHWLDSPMANFVIDQKPTHNRGRKKNESVAKFFNSSYLQNTLRRRCPIKSHSVFLQYLLVNSCVTNEARSLIFKTKHVLLTDYSVSDVKLSPRIVPGGPTASLSCSVAITTACLHMIAESHDDTFVNVCKVFFVICIMIVITIQLPHPNVSEIQSKVLRNRIEHS